MSSILKKMSNTKMSLKPQEMMMHLEFQSRGKRRNFLSCLNRVDCLHPGLHCLAAWPVWPTLCEMALKFLPPLDLW